jgi:hypothetical protein
MDWPNWIMAISSLVIMVSTIVTACLAYRVKRDSDADQKKIQELLNNMICALLVSAAPGYPDTAVGLFHAQLEKLKEYSDKKSNPNK